MGQFDGKVAIVTGASSGIGRASVKLFAQHGAAVLALVVPQPSTLRRRRWERSMQASRARRLELVGSTPCTTAQEALRSTWVA